MKMNSLGSIDFTLIYIVGSVVIFLICVLGCIISYFRCFILDRTKGPTVFLPIRYFTEHPDVEMDDIRYKSSVSKIRRRKQRLRRLNAFLRAKKVDPNGSDEDDAENSNDEEKGEIEEEEEEGQNETNSRKIDPYASSKSSNLRRSMLFLRSSFLNFMSFDGGSQKSAIPSASKKGKSTKSRKRNRGASFLSQSENEKSTKSKRFISQDRLDRAEARKALVATTGEEVEPEDEKMIEETYDEERERQKRVQAIIERRKHTREEIKTEYTERGIVDVVALNAGPKQSEVPKGFVVVEFIPDLNPDYLIYKRVLYKYEDPTKAFGWFLGTIVGTSKSTGKNFNIKYDRAETGTRFVDGMHTVSLSLEGENAYGRRWVVIEWKGPGKRPGKILAILTKGQFVSEEPGPLVRAPSKKMTAKERKKLALKQQNGADDDQLEFMEEGVLMDVPENNHEDMSE